MKVKMLNNPPKQLNTLDKNCLSGTESADYVDEDDSERYFSIHDNDTEIANITACLSPEKAGIQLVRMRKSDKDLERQKEILKEFTNFVFDVSNMNQFILAVHVLVDGSGIDCRVLERIGFIGSILGRGSGYYTLLNPAYMDLVETYATNEEATEILTENYDVYQLSIEAQKKELEKLREKSTLYLSDCKDETQRGNLQNDIDFYTEAINSLSVQEQKSNHL